MWLEQSHKKNSVSQIEGVSDMVPHTGSVGRRLRKGTIAFDCLFVWEKAVLELLP